MNHHLFCNQQKSEQRWLVEQKVGSEFQFVPSFRPRPKSDIQEKSIPSCSIIQSSQLSVKVSEILSLNLSSPASLLLYVS